MGGDCRSAVGTRRFIELWSGIALHLRTDQVGEFLVADADVAAALVEFDVSGLRPAQAPSLEADRKEVPFFGNLARPTWLSVSFGGHCDSRCLFCFSEWTRRVPQLSTAQVMSALEGARSVRGLRSVVFTGGEPTLRPDLPECIAHARGLGFEEIQVQSNGHQLQSEDYTRALVNAGLSGVLLSLHGASAAVHDGIARHRGSFALASRALRVLGLTPSLRVAANCVVCLQNMHEVARLPSLVAAQAPGRTIRFSFPIVEGEAYTRSHEVVPRLADFVDTVRTAIAAAEDLGLRASVANVPACVSSLIGVSPSYLLSQRRSMLGVAPFISEDVLRGERSAKLSACMPCRFAKDCSGFQLAHLRHDRDVAEVIGAGPNRAGR